MIINFVLLATVAVLIATGVYLFLDRSLTKMLMGALLMEQSEKWQTGCKYFEMDLYYQAMKKDSKDTFAA